MRRVHGADWNIIGRKDLTDN